MKWCICFSIRAPLGNSLFLFAGPSKVGSVGRQKKVMSEKKISENFCYGTSLSGCYKFYPESLLIKIHSDC